MSIKRLISRIEETGSAVVVGIDPDISRMEEQLVERCSTTEKILFEFSKQIIDGVYDIVPAVKLQIAYFEMYGLDGMSAYSRAVRYAASKGLYVIGDIKRGDIGSTAAAYAKAHLGKGSDFEVDSVTINPYLGDDSNNEFLKYVKEDKGAFLLVKTSNPTSGQIQDLKSNETEIYEKVAANLESNELIQDEGYLGCGIVVGATYKEQLEEIRRNHPRLFMLIPGYGAQGGSAQDIAAAFDDKGLGAIVNSSRGIIYAHKRYNLPSMEAARKAAMEMNEDLNKWRKKNI